MNCSGNMKFSWIVFVVCYFLATEVKSQFQQYVPAQVLIPIFQNGTLHSPYNNSLYNISSFNNSNFRNDSNGHVFLGSKSTIDRLLFNQEITKTSRWWSTREKTIVYPNDQPTGYVRREKISAINLTNRFLGGNHSNAKIVAGGVGYGYVKILLKSERGYGFSYLVQIYGH